MNRLTATLLALAFALPALAQEAPAPEGAPEKVQPNEKVQPEEGREGEAPEKGPKVTREVIDKELAKDEDAIDYTAPKLEDWTELDEAAKVAGLRKVFVKYDDLFDREFYGKAEMVRIHEVVPRIDAEFDLVTKLVGDKDPKVQQLGYSLLTLAGVDRAEQAVRFLTDKLDAAEELTPAETRLAALAIGKLPRVGATTAGVLSKEKDKALQEKLAAMKKLAEQQYQAVYDDAMDRLKDPSARQREAAVVALGELAAPQAIDPLQRRLENETAAKAEITERLYIYEALAKIGSPEVVDYLEQRKAGTDNLLEQIAIADTIYRLGKAPDLRLIAGSMGNLQEMLKKHNVGEETRHGQKIVTKSLDDLIEDLVRQMSRKPEPESKKDQKGQKGAMKKADSKAGASEEGGKAAQGMRPGVYDGSGMDEQGAKELEKITQYLHDRVDDWGTLPEDKKKELIETLKNGSIPPRYKKLLDKYFENIAKGRPGDR